ncbi:MAG TPA: hypothetical protein VK909_19450 [Anaerolineales bacterium]|nr:hypothetical protein [Anaerolineales bacterium]
MKIFDKPLILLFLAAIILTSCNSSLATSPTDVMETAISTVNTAVAETELVIPTATPISLATVAFPTAIAITPTAILASPTPLVFTDPSIPMSERIVYYYFVTTAENPIPEGSVAIMPNALILAPTPSDTAYSPDTAADLRIALEAVLNDKRNIWINKNLEITNIAFNEGHANIVMNGEYFAVAPIVLTAARAQILMTLFANAAVQTATVTLNGDTIANIAISISSDAKPTDYVYIRTEIETFIAEHVYTAP